MRDSNSKVNLQALQTMARMVPILRDSMSSIVNLSVQTIAANLASKNQEILSAASSLLDSLMDNLGKMSLCGGFVQ